jgi:hypothetical protein
VGRRDDPNLETRAKEDAEQRKKISTSSPQPTGTFAYSLLGRTAQPMVCKSHGS